MAIPAVTAVIAVSAVSAVSAVPSGLSQAMPGAALANNPDASVALWPLGLHAVVVVAIVAVALVATHFVGPRHHSRRKDLPYESGMAPTGDVNVAFPIRFYMVAIAFLVFDLEVAYLFGWAVAARRLGWAGLAEVSFFIALLFAGLLYVWWKGALNWGVSSPSLASRAARESLPTTGSMPGAGRGT